MISIEIPNIKCPAGCHRCCNPVIVTVEEARRLGIPGEVWTGKRGDGKCRFLGKKGCTVYRKRPLACHLFGTASTGPISCAHVSRKDNPRLLDLQEMLLVMRFLYEKLAEGGNYERYMADPEKHDHCRMMDKKEFGA